MIPRVLARGAGRWADRRLRLSKMTRRAIGKIFPDHWSFMLGEIALYSFIVLLVTGVYLTLFFEGSTAERPYSGSYSLLQGSETSAAYASTMEISFDVRAGLLIRQVHHWAALIFLAAIVVHLSRIFFTAAFRRPRELNWIVGVTLLLLAILNGFLGYSLPDDLLSGTGLRIMQAVLLSVPLVGSWLEYLIFGGPFPGRELEQRMYAAHILLVPGVILALISVHMAVLIRQKHTDFAGQGRSDRNVVGSRVWPTYAFRSLALLCAVLGICFALGGFIQINPIWLWGPFDPAAVTSPAQPDWYIGWLDGALRLFPPWEFRIAGYLVPSPFWPAAVLPMLTFLGLYAWPWIDKAITHDRREHHVLGRVRDVPVRVAVGTAALTFYGLLLLAGANDIAARVWQVSVHTIVWVMRIAVIVLPLLAGLIAWFLASRLRTADVDHLVDLPLSGLRPARTESTGQAAETESPEPLPEAPHLAVRGEDAPDPLRARASR